MTYNPWPLGNVPESWQRSELKDLSEIGYAFNDAREIVDIFETKLAKYSGSKYAVTVDSASSGLFLALKYLNCSGQVKIPRQTYVSVAMQIHHAGCDVTLEDIEWSGIYQLKPTKVFDSAARFTPGMYVGDGALQVLSFQIKKRVPIGKGGAILTDDKAAYDWLRLARYDGRDLSLPYDDPGHVKQIGWHMYMTPEDAARGILLMDKLGSGSHSDVASRASYPDITHWVKQNISD